VKRGLVKRTTAVLAVVASLAAGAAFALAAPASPAGAARTFGSTPYNDVRAAAAATGRDCTVSDDGLAALVLSVIWGETGAPTNEAPSPMTLSRYDTSDALYAFSNPNTSYRGAFWHAGVGLWQFDSAGGSSTWGMGTAAQSISTATQSASGFAAGEMARRYCNASGTGAQRRAAAWSPWNACRSGGCETVFREIYNTSTKQLRNLVGTTQVGRYGGMETRLCSRGAGPTFTCYFIDPARAQGFDGWATPGWGSSPVTEPFYVYRDGSNEVRVWLKEHTGYSIDIAATRPLGQNVRSSVTWYSSNNLCAKVSSAQTYCDVSPSHLFFDEIEWVSDQGIAEGYADGDFKPSAAVSRQAMAAFLYRLMGSPSSPAAPSTATFTDVSRSHTFFREIEWLHARGVIDGYDDGTYRPLNGVTRQATAAFLYRLDPTPNSPTARSTGHTFRDVARNHPFWREIEWIEDVGIADGYSDGTFKPGATVTRQAMAAFLQRFDAAH
jgi:hypothetical protein